MPQPNLNLNGEREAFSYTTISRSLLVSSTYYFLHSRNLEHNIWRIINKSQDEIFNPSPYPEPSVILNNKILETERRDSKSSFLSLISVSQTRPGNVLNLSVLICYMELQCPLHREFLWEPQRSVHEKYLPQNVSTASVFSSINKVNNSTHFIRDCVKINWVNISKVIKTVFGTRWRL